MSRVAMIGTNHKGKLAVLALGDYSGSWRISRGAFVNEARIECRVTGRGTVETFFLIDSNVIVFSCPLVAEQQQVLGRKDATYTMPALTVELRVPAGVELDSPAVAAIQAVL